MIKNKLNILAISLPNLGGNDNSFVNAFRRAGHSVKAISPASYYPLWRHSKLLKIGRKLLTDAVAKEFNHAVLAAAAETKPDLFFAFKGQYLFASTLKALKDKGIITVQFYPDTGFETHSRYLLKALIEYDWIFSTKPNHIQIFNERFGYNNISYQPHACDPYVHKPIKLSARDKARYSCDVSFIGTISKKKFELIRDISTAIPDIDLKVWGPKAWHKLDKFAPDAYQGNSVWGLEYAKAINASKINLGILFEGNPGHEPDYLTARTFEILGAGGFMLHERTKETLEFFAEDKDCAYFSDLSELKEKIECYLSTPTQRKAIAQHGHKTTMTRGHTVDNRVNTVLEKYWELHPTDE